MTGSIFVIAYVAIKIVISLWFSSRFFKYTNSDASRTPSAIAYAALILFALGSVGLLQIFEFGVERLLSTSASTVTGDVRLENAFALVAALLYAISMHFSLKRSKKQETSEPGKTQ
jgi:hypothetical protein